MNTDKRVTIHGNSEDINETEIVNRYAKAG